MEIMMEFTMKVMKTSVELWLWPQTLGACHGCQASALVVVCQPIYRLLLNIPTHLVPSKAFGAHGNPLCRYFANYQVVDCLSYAVCSKRPAHCAVCSAQPGWGWMCADWCSCCVLVHVAAHTLWHTVAHCGTLGHTVAHCGSCLCRKTGIPVSRSQPSTCMLDILDQHHHQMTWRSILSISSKVSPHAESNLLEAYCRPYSAV